MTGLPAFDRVHGQTFYSYLNLHPEAAAAFDRGMTAYSQRETAAILAAYDFGDDSNVIDLGGGQGALLIAILKAFPRARAVLFDQESVVERARGAMARAEVAARCTIEPGSFFEAVPAGGDVYILNSILHNWDDERSVAILKSCRGAMRPGSKSLIVERLVPEGNEPSEAKLFDVNMLVVLGGLERTTMEYRSILDKAGFDLARVVPTAPPVSILEAVPRSV
jgi:precorrin-6B methylase 2